SMPAGYRTRFGLPGSGAAKPSPARVVDGNRHLRTRRKAPITEGVPFASGSPQAKRYLGSTFRMFRQTQTRRSRLRDQAGLGANHKPPRGPTTKDSRDRSGWVNGKHNEPQHIGRLNGAGGCARKGVPKRCRNKRETTRASEAGDGKMVRRPTN